MEAKITKEYISKNSKWLGNGDYLTMGVMDLGSDWEDCKGLFRILCTLTDAIIKFTFFDIFSSFVIV